MQSQYTQEHMKEHEKEELDAPKLLQYAMNLATVVSQVFNSVNDLNGSLHELEDMMKNPEKLDLEKIISFAQNLHKKIAPHPEILCLVGFGSLVLNCITLYQSVTLLRELTGKFETMINNNIKLINANYREIGKAIQELHGFIVDGASEISSNGSELLKRLLRENISMKLDAIDNKFREIQQQIKTTLIQIEIDVQRACDCKLNSYKNGAWSLIKGVIALTEGFINNDPSKLAHFFFWCEHSAWRSECRR